MRLTFIGAAHEVTGSCHYLQIGEKHILVDCGMEQGPDLYENQELPVNAAVIDYVFVTHAHIDHSGLLPLLYARGFRGQVFATNATAQLCSIMLRDSAHIQEAEAEWKNRKARRAGRKETVPIYTMDDAVGVLGHFVPCDYDREISVCEGISLRFRDAGHLLGSAFLEIKATEDGQERKLVFSGDIGNGNRPLIKDPKIPSGADYLIMESTYGDRTRKEVSDYAADLAPVLARTFARGGNVVIPAFSVGRTQEMLYYLREIKQRKMVPSFPDFEVYVDSPLAVEATNIFHKNVSECFSEPALAMIREGVNPIRFPGLKTAVTSEESIAINFVQKPVVIISASGMCEAGRIRHHLKHNLWRSECTIVFVGYQVPGTLGAHLLGGADEVRLFGETVQVKAEILKLPGMSAHADREHLTAWVMGMKEKPGHIFVVHGEDSVCDRFAEHIEKAVGTRAIAPYSGDVYDLLAERMVAYGSRTRAEKKSRATQTRGVFDRLLAAGQRLLAVIQKNREIANKDMAKFADQINSLCDKWDR